MTQAEPEQHVDWISVDHPDTVEATLRRVGWLAPNDTLDSLEPAGQGNMNCTLRAVRGHRSVIVKQARPWVERYPSIEAPVERALYEIQFYEAVRQLPTVAQRMPKLIGSEPDQYTLVLEDLGAARDGSRFYDDPTSIANVLDEVAGLIAWLRELHEGTSGRVAVSRFRNLPLRRLNHKHMFEIPLQDPPAIDLDAITPGLSHLAMKVQQNACIIARCHELGVRYLQPGDTLLHGDFFPGSWLFSGATASVIDPEFCFAGEREFDLAIAAAHLAICELVDSPVEWVLCQYGHDGCTLDPKLIEQWSAVEILRRLLGVAQLPMHRTLEQKSKLIEYAVHLLVS